jgi:heme A synthase
MTRFARYAWCVLGINLLVIAWGAFVRASGSGAGCGSHWPLCHGVVVPHAPAVATVIEFAHRVTSGVALLCVIGLVVFARRVFRAGAPARLAAYGSMLLIVTEALVGAGLVLFEMVARNASVARGWWMTAHLLNTFLLLAALALTAWLGGQPTARRWRITWPKGALALGLLVFALALGVSGAITALGDTLFPAETLRQGMALDFDASAHLFIRLRVWHPLLAVTFAVAAIVGSRALAVRARDPGAAQWANVCAGLVLVQILTGVTNLLALAPVGLQLAHLLLADLVWIALVLSLATSLTAPMAGARLRV